VSSALACLFSANICAYVACSVQEWCMTIETLPGFLRMVASMQYYSSAQWVRYMTLQERPNVFRAVERTLSRFPDARSGFVGRMLADPAFMQKTALEGAISFAIAAAHEVHVRGKRIRDEWDLAVVSAGSVALSTAICAALVAPSKTPSPPAAVFPWQRMLNKLPNNAFEKNTPARSFGVPHRVTSFFAKGLEISAVYAVMGAVSAALQHCLVAARRARDPNAMPITPLPGISRSALGMGLFGALAANTRLQAAAGLDRTLLEYAKASTTLQVIGLSALFRSVSQAAIENPAGVGPSALVACSRPALAGTPVHHVPSPVKPTARKVRKLVKRRPAPKAAAGSHDMSASQASAPALAQAGAVQADAVA
jgi:Protein RETICULATA-related